jgi:hypothetical protein
VAGDVVELQVLSMFQFQDGRRWAEASCGTGKGMRHNLMLELSSKGGGQRARSTVARGGGDRHRRVTAPREIGDEGERGWVGWRPRSKKGTGLVGGHYARLVGRLSRADW